jgi:hypothetical protein
MPLMPPGGAGGPLPGAGGMSAAALAGMSPAMRAAYGAAFTASLNTVFLVAAGACAVGFAFTWLLPERPLRATVAAAAAPAVLDRSPLRAPSRLPTTQAG